MILGVNGIRLIGNRSGVARCIEAVLRCMAEMDHPFREDPSIHAQAGPPGDHAAAVRRQCGSADTAAARPVGAAHASAGAWQPDVLFCPSYVIPLLAAAPRSWSTTDPTRGTPGIQLVDSEQGPAGLLVERPQGNSRFHGERIQQARHGALLRHQAGTNSCSSGRR